MTRPVLVAERRFAAEPSASSAVRSFVGEHAHQIGLGARGEDAALVASELATNVVLHARTDFEVRLLRLDGGARIEVEDRSASLPIPGTLSLTAMSGRGLTLVQAVAARCGVDRVAAGKVVWCEICARAASRVDSLSVEQLLSLWGDDEPDDADLQWLTRRREHVEPRTVVVPDLPTGQLIAAKVHMEDLLRELQLMLIHYTGSSADQCPPTTPEAMHLARRLVGAADEFSDGIRQVRAQAMAAAERGDPVVTLRLLLPPSAAAAAARYRDAVHEAAGLPATLYLTNPIGSDAPIRTHYLTSVIEQLGAA